MASLLAQLRGRALPLLLVAGSAAATTLFVPHLPHEHHVDLRLDDARSVTGVDVAWTPSGDIGDARDGELVQTGEWRFAAGKAPRSVGTTVHLPDGRYGLDVTVERGEERQTFHRLITLGDAESIAVPLR